MDIISLSVAFLCWSICWGRRYPMSRKLPRPWEGPQSRSRYFRDPSKEQWTNNDLVTFPDYDVIEVFQNTTFGLGEEDISFVALKDSLCAPQCVRGLSGLCICPPPQTAAASTNSSLHHQSKQHNPRKLLKQRAYVGTGSRHQLPWTRLNRVKREDEDEDENQKLCKCRHCRKLFKRTLYCRVFPCYQKKCKSGEWKEH